MTHNVYMLDGRILRFYTASECNAFAAGFNQHVPALKSKKPAFFLLAQRKAFMRGKKEFEKSGGARVATEAEALAALARLSRRDPNRLGRLRFDN